MKNCYPACTKCIHYRERAGAYADVCLAQPSLVDGGPDDSWRKYCSIQRKDNALWAWVSNSCGKQGRFFQPTNSPGQESRTPQ